MVMEKGHVTQEGEIKTSSSFHLERNTKGVNVSVKVYVGDSVDDIDNAMQECTRRFDELIKKYKM